MKSVDHHASAARIHSNVIFSQRPDVVSIPLKDVIDSRIVLAYLKDRRLTASARTFVELYGEDLDTLPRETIWL